MKATEELVHTHAVVLKLLEIFTVDNPRFGESIKTLRRAVEAHAWLQDEIFLPALKGKPLIEPRLVDELVQEHKDLDAWLGQLLKTPLSKKKEVGALVLQIRALLETHAKKEVGALYALADEVLDETTLERLRAEMDRRKLEVRDVIKMN